MRTMTVRMEFKKCGRGCFRCPHGPYYYGYWREGGKVRCKYLGTEKPQQAPPVPEPPAEDSSLLAGRPERLASSASSASSAAATPAAPATATAIWDGHHDGGLADCLAAFDLSPEELQSREQVRKRYYNRVSLPNAGESYKHAKWQCFARICALKNWKSPPYPT